MFPETVAQQFGEQTFGGSALETSRLSLRLTFFWSLSRKMFPEIVAQQFGGQIFGGRGIGSTRSRAGGDAVDRADPSEEPTMAALHRRELGSRGLLLQGNREA